MSKLKNEMLEFEKQALELTMPIIQRDALEYIVGLLNANGFSDILEIGSCIGYSAILLVSNVNEGYVETIEIDEERYHIALKNIETYGKEGVVMIHHDDALSFNETFLHKKEFDCLFIDAAKAQYQKFFEKYAPYVKDNGVIIVDNLDFHGMVFHIEEIKNRNTKQLVKKIKNFKDWILNHANYDCEYVRVGDGLAIIKKK